MKYLSGGVVCFFLLGAAQLSAVDYSSITAPAVIVTGVRSTSASTDNVFITGSQTTAGVTSAVLYNGSLAAAAGAPPSSWVVLSPSFSGQTVTGATLYGPNSALFTPSIGTGNVMAVGSYKYAEGASGAQFDHGLLYQGAAGGGGTFTQIDATSLVASGTLKNTIAHSTMGNLVVGNYDTSLATGNAFIYNASTLLWTNLNPGGSASATAYGIWQNGGSDSTSFTIAGGLSDLNSGGLDEGYLVDYDSSTGLLSHFTKFNYNNEPVSALISHFDGITATENGFNLTGDYLVAGGGLGAFYVSIDRSATTGAYSNATWTDIAFPSAQETSGNTVVGNTVLGIYVAGGVEHSYIATVPEPATAMLLLSGAGLLGLRRRKA
jgi:hypothetical protein